MGHFLLALFCRTRDVLHRYAIGQRSNFLDLVAVRSALRLICLIAWSFVLCWPAAAQSELEQSDRNDVTRESPTGISSAAPDIYLLPDEHGKLRQVLGFGYEDFLEAWQIRNKGSRAQPPRYVIDTLRMDGTAQQRGLLLHVEIDLTTLAGGWVSVELQLPDLIVHQAVIEDRETGECLLFERERLGYVCWLQGKAGRKRHLRLIGFVKAKPNSDRSHLELRPPRATNSKSEFHVPGTGIDFEVAPGIDMTVQEGESTTRVSLSGYANPLRLNWSRAEEILEPRNSVLESQDRTTVHLEEGQARISSQLQINSFGEALRLLQVKIPPLATSTRVQVPESLQAVVTEVEKEIDGKLVRLIEVRPQQPVVEPWVLELEAEQPIAQSDESGTVVLGGFELLHAVRQTGDLTLSVDDHWQAYFELKGALEQVSLDETVAFASGESSLASFHYGRLPWSLDVHTLPRKRRVSVQPQYDLRMTPDEARLNIEFDYQFSGARTFVVRIDLREWQLTDDPLESGGAVDTGRVVESRDGLLILPLTNPDFQRAHISFVVRKDLQLGAQSFPLPEPLEGFVLPGKLSVAADPSLQVMPDASALTGLSSFESNTQESASPDSSPLSFRTFLSRAELNAEITLRERLVHVLADATVTVHESSLSVLQRLEYEVKYRPLSRITLLLPQALQKSEPLAVKINGEEISFAAAVEDSVAPQASQRLIVPLPRAMQNSFLVEIAYPVTYQVVQPDEPAQIALPLVLPADPITQQKVLVQTTKPLRASLSLSNDSDVWVTQSLEQSPRLTQSELKVLATGGQPMLPLTFHQDSIEQLQRANLERAWMQTWVVGKVQQDRAVFRLRSSHSHAIVHLPFLFDSVPMEVLLDGGPVDVEPRSEKQIGIPLPDEMPGRSHVVELRYQRPIRLGTGRSLQTTPPRLECRSISAPVYWQLVLPRDWHVVQSPKSMASESWLGWSNLHWGRQSSQSQSDLEQWVGATTLPSPSPSTVQLLYSGFEFPARLRVKLAHRAWLILASTLVAFGVGLLVIYTAVAKQRAFWLGLALVLSVLLFGYPEVAWLGGQAIVGGGVLTLLAVALRRIFVETPTPDIVFAPSSAIRGSSVATESWDQNQLGEPGDEDEPTAIFQSEGSKT